MKLSEIKTFPVIVEFATEQYTVYAKHSGNFLAVDERDAPMFLNKNVEYTLVVPKKILHKYLMKSVDAHQPLRPILTFHFESQDEAKYYCNQHGYAVISYEGEVEVNDGTV